MRLTSFGYKQEYQPHGTSSMKLVFPGQNSPFGFQANFAFSNINTPTREMPSPMPNQEAAVLHKPRRSLISFWLLFHKNQDVCIDYIVFQQKTPLYWRGTQISSVPIFFYFYPIFICFPPFLFKTSSQASTNLNNNLIVIKSTSSFPNLKPSRYDAIQLSALQARMISNTPLFLGKAYLQLKSKRSDVKDTSVLKI